MVGACQSPSSRPHPIGDNSVWDPLYWSFSPRIKLNIRFPQIGLNSRRRSRSPPLPTTWEGSSSSDSSSSDSSLSDSSPPGPSLPNPLGAVTRFVPNSESAKIRKNTGKVRWSNSELVKIQKKNTDNVHCVSWVLKDITDPEALDAAVQLAGTIWWFEDGIDVKPIYDLLISTFRACFGSDRTLHQGLRDRAYYSGRAIIWIYTLAVCKSEELAREFYFPGGTYKCPRSYPGLFQLTCVFDSRSLDQFFTELLIFIGRHTHAHLQWTSNLLLHLSWTTQTGSSFYESCLKRGLREVNASTPLDVLSNLLLMLSHFLGSPIEEEVLKIQNKSYDISFLYLRVTHTTVH